MQSIVDLLGVNPVCVRYTEQYDATIADAVPSIRMAACKLYAEDSPRAFSFSVGTPYMLSLEGRET